ncbi:GNAT family N-acetyltransferase [Saccharothrix sp. ST-888]|uniref:GNAT family N-acetyltransferase n=1 Tax=Saccharothrix sp. ST-888 TaxID=1427391 RepID=UPI0005EC74BF|nr:GNAT family N-acetyltransferase [Saccharothrix sp. ST-888]
MIGERVRLVPLGSQHAEPFWQATLAPENRRLAGSRREFTLDSIRAWCADRATQPHRLDLAIEDRTTGGYLGELALIDVDHGSESVAFRLALGHAFEQIRLDRVQLEVCSFNSRAVKAYQKADFTLEGRLRDAHMWEGRRYDVLCTAALRSEWRTPAQ